MEPINKTQTKIYEFLVERSMDGVPPTVREIGQAVGLKSTSSVQFNLDALEQAGYIA
ncbi:MAG: transcriptional repressor LexA, partial [Clostridia bacterium]|nr:transcriptional repressor LexA [Clostridia bacterium]